MPGQLSGLDCSGGSARWYRWDVDRDPPEGDPEAARIDELLERHLGGDATDAESEELALYHEERPDLRAKIDETMARGPVGHGWLERARKDEAIAAIDTSARARMERATGLALLVGGWGLSIPLPAVGVPMMGIGLILLMYSIVRVRLATHRDDPYKDIQR